MRRLSLFILFAISSIGLSFSQSDDAIEFIAKVSKEEFSIDERVRIEFTINKEGADNFTSPNFEGFDVIGGPSTSVQRSWINGVSTFSFSYTYILMPRNIGTFTIKQATIEYKGNLHKTVPIKIKVTKSTGTTTAGGISNSDNNRVILIPEISNSSPYLNEAFYLNYTVYIDTNINISNFSEIQAPSFDHFFEKEIPIDEYKLVRKNFNGKVYNSFVIRKKVLYPQKTGKLSIEPYTVKFVAKIPTGRYTVFGQDYATKYINVSSKKKTISVKKIPEKGKPINFSNVVGNFSLSMLADKSELKATESLQIVIQIKGQGLLNFVTPPKLEVPNSIDVYDPEINKKENYIKSTYTLVPLSKGNFTIPGVEFSYFDPKKHKYVNLKSNDINFNVLKAPYGSAIVSTTKREGQDRVVINNAPVQQFNFIKTKTNLIPITVVHFIDSWGFYLLSLLIVLVTAIIYIVGTKNIKLSRLIRKNTESVDSSKLSKKYLSQAKKNIDKSENFYIALERCLSMYFKSKLKIKPSEQTKDLMTQRLNSNGVSDDVIHNLLNLISKCETARYSPISNESNEMIYNEAVAVLSLIDKELKKR